MGSREISKRLQKEADLSRQGVASDKRADLSAFVARRRHIRSTAPHDPVSVSAIALSIGVARSTVRRWLKVDHAHLYWAHWARLCRSGGRVLGRHSEGSRVTSVRFVRKKLRSGDKPLWPR